MVVAGGAAGTAFGFSFGFGLATEVVASSVDGAAASVVTVSGSEATLVAAGMSASSVLPPVRSTGRAEATGSAQHDARDSGCRDRPVAPSRPTARAPLPAQYPDSSSARSIRDRSPSDGVASGRRSVR